MLADLECNCEDNASSAHGVVQDVERLARFAVHPRHFKPSGELKPNFFPVSHFQNGLSVTRIDVIGQAELRRQGDLQLTTPGDQLRGVVLSSASYWRSEMGTGGVRLFCVCDDPIEDNDAHACILATPAHVDDTEIRRLRGQLIDQGVTALADIHT